MCSMFAKSITLPELLVFVKEISVYASSGSIGPHRFTLATLDAQSIKLITRTLMFRGTVLGVI